MAEERRVEEEPEQTSEAQEAQAALEEALTDVDHMSMSY